MQVSFRNEKIEVETFQEIKFSSLMTLFSSVPLLADTIVECGRRTLTNAISLANSWGKNEQNKWHGCKVIYGDTDSVFVKLPGRSVQEAFQFGEEFCKAVTAANPPPVQLKLEKVYFGSIMQTVCICCKLTHWRVLSLIIQPLSSHHRKRNTVE